VTRKAKAKVRRATEFCGCDVCLRNSFLGVKTWSMVEEKRRIYSWTSIFVLNYAPPPARSTALGT